MFVHVPSSKIDIWMDALRFYVIFNSISVISGRWEFDNERLVQWNSIYGCTKIEIIEDRQYPVLAPAGAKISSRFLKCKTTVMSNDHDHSDALYTYTV